MHMQVDADKHVAFQVLLHLVQHVEPTLVKAGDLVVIKASKRRDKLTPGARPDVFKVVRFTSEETSNAILTDASVPPKL